MPSVSLVQEDGSPFSDDEMLEFLRNLMIAGRDTTAVTLTWYDHSRTWCYFGSMTDPSCAVCQTSPISQAVPVQVIFFLLLRTP